MRAQNNSNLSRTATTRMPSLKKFGKLRVVIKLGLKINMVLFVVFRTASFINGDCGADLVMGREVPKDGFMNYLVPGCFDQAQASFDHWLTDNLDDGITYVRYQNRGYSIKQTTEDIIADIRRHHYQKVRVIGISIGDYVGRQLESRLDPEEIELETYSINPEPDARILKPGARAAAFAGSVFLKAVSLPCGFLSILPVPILPDKDVITLANFGDQLWDIAFARSSWRTNRDQGVIYSSNDEFLRNDVILRDCFYDVPQEMALAKHGDIVNNAEAYIKAWKNLQHKIAKSKKE